MAIETRTKDKIALLVAVPLALLAAYWHFWRADAARRADMLEQRSAALVSPEDYPAEKLRAERRLSDSADELAAEKAMPWPEGKVKDADDAPFAKRESKVLSVLRESGLTVLRSEVVQGDAAAAGGSAGDAIRRAVAGESRPAWAAEGRRYTLDGSYPAVKRALDAFAERQMAVIPTKIEMRESGRGRWTLEVWM